MISELLPTKLLENLNTAVLMLDLDLKLSHINSAAENLLGLSGSRHIGESIEKILLSSDSLMTTLNETIQSQVGHILEERQFYRP